MIMINIKGAEIYWQNLETLYKGPLRYSGFPELKHVRKSNPFHYFKPLTSNSDKNVIRLTDDNDNETIFMHEDTPLPLSRWPTLTFSHNAFHTHHVA